METVSGQRIYCVGLREIMVFAPMWKTDCFNCDYLRIKANFQAADELTSANATAGEIQGYTV